VADELHVLSERISAGTADLRRARRQGEQYGDSTEGPMASLSAFSRAPQPQTFAKGSLDQALALSPSPAPKHSRGGSVPSRDGKPGPRAATVPGLRVQRTLSVEAELNEVGLELDQYDGQPLPSEQPMFGGLAQPMAEAELLGSAAGSRRTSTAALRSWLFGGETPRSPEQASGREPSDCSAATLTPPRVLLRRDSALAAFDVRTSVRRSSGLNELFRVSLERAELVNALEAETDGSAFSDDDELASALDADAAGGGHSFTLPPEQVEVVVRALRNRAARTEADVAVLTELLTQAVGESSSFHPLASLLVDCAVCAAALEHLRLRIYRRGERLIDADVELSNAFLILRGSVRVSCDGPAAAAGEPFDDDDNPPSLGALEAHGLRNIQWAARADGAAIELSATLVGGDCIGGADMSDAKALRFHLADGNEQPPGRAKRFGADAVALVKTLVISVPIPTIERIYMRTRDANCAQIHAHISDMQLFKHVPADGLVRLARLMEVVTHARGDVIVEQGAPLGEVCFVRSGQCRASRLVQPPGGAPPVRCDLGLLWSFEWFGELLVLEPEAIKSRATISAETITTLYKLPAVHAPELYGVRETLKADFLTRYPSDKVLLARRGQQRRWSSYKKTVVLDVVATSRAVARARREQGF
jgi:CRP-like cAMP-binding protein